MGRVLRVSNKRVRIHISADMAVVTMGSNVDRKLWTEVINNACYILNRVVFQQAETKTSYEKWFNCKL